MRWRITRLFPVKWSAPMAPDMVHLGLLADQGNQRSDLWRNRRRCSGSTCWELVLSYVPDTGWRRCSCGCLSEGRAGIHRCGIVIITIEDGHSCGSHEDGHSCGGHEDGHPAEAVAEDVVPSHLLQVLMSEKPAVPITEELLMMEHSSILLMTVASRWNSSAEQARWSKGFDAAVANMEVGAGW